MIRTKKNILIIEDSLATTILLRDFLIKLGYENVEYSRDGKSGITLFDKLVKSGKIPIVLLDFHLPDMNANQIMKSIFEIRPDVKIILETADTKSEEQIKNALQGGVYMYIEKPIRFENLKKVFETLEQESNDIHIPANDDLKKIRMLLKSSSRISIARIFEYSKIEINELKKYIQKFEDEKKITKISDLKEIRCNQCGSLRILPNFFCPACNSTNFFQGKLIEHFKCGNISLEGSYKENKCPKCKKDIKIIGIDYKSIDNHYICNNCGDKFSEPSQDYICLNCNNSFPLEKAKWITSAAYKPSKFL